MNKSAVRRAMAEFLERLTEDFDEDSEIGIVAIIGELRHDDSEGETCTSIVYWCSDSRVWIQAGLFQAAADMAA